jgi:hypothetical protein
MVIELVEIHYDNQKSLKLRMNHKNREIIKESPTSQLFLNFE